MSLISGFISIIISVLVFIGGLILFLWWIWLPWFLYTLARDLWLKYRRNQFASKIEWVLLEVKPSRDIKKTPHAMEHVFSALHGAHSEPGFDDWFFKGYMQRWFSFELISQGGQVRFLVRTPTIFRNLVEAEIYAQYPEVEIKEVDDYVNSIPDDLPNDQYDIWGTELILANDNAYPIRTYAEFEKEAKSDDQRVDSMAAMMEGLSKLKPGEQVWYQMLVRPVSKHWAKEALKVRDKLAGRKEKKEKGVIAKEVDALWGEVRARSDQAVTGEYLGVKQSEEKKDDVNKLLLKTKGELDIINAIENHISKTSFEALIRVVLVGPAGELNKTHFSAVMGGVKAYGTQHLNGLKPNLKVQPSFSYYQPAKKRRGLYRIRKAFKNYKQRYFCQYSKGATYLNQLSFEKWPILRWIFLKSKPFIFNVEELATVYHFPSEPVKTPLVPKVESKKSEPPTDLPTQ